MSRISILQFFITMSSFVKITNELDVVECPIYDQALVEKKKHSAGAPSVGVGRWNGDGRGGWLECGCVFSTCGCEHVFHIMGACGSTNGAKIGAINSFFKIKI